MGDMRDAVVVEHDTRLELGFCLRQFRWSHPVTAHLVQRLDERRLDIGERHAAPSGRRDRVNERLLGGQHGARHGGRQTALDQRAE
jgi:hypothetical protein